MVYSNNSTTPTNPTTNDFIMPENIILTPAHFSPLCPEASTMPKHLGLTDIEFEEGEVALVMEAALAGGQTLQEFIAQAVREGLEKFRATQTFFPS